MGLFDTLFGKRSGRDKKAPAGEAPSRSQYRGVQIEVDVDNCCRAVKAIAGRRFLSSEVPALPVDLCDAANCNCKYALFNDRRTDTRRASDLVYDVASDLYPDNHRNDGVPGRRQDDG